MPVPTPYNDTELLQRLGSGDKEVFAHIFREYYSALCAFAEKIIGSPDDVEDLVEEVFEKLWNRKPHFENIRHLKDFLYKVTRNACLDFIKNSIHRKERQARFLQTENDVESASDLCLIRAEVYREIYREIMALPEQCGKIIRMGYIEGKRNEEIARELDLSVQTVKNQKSRGILLLKLRLSPELFVLLALMTTPT